MQLQKNLGIEMVKESTSVDHKTNMLQQFVNNYISLNVDTETP